MSVIYCGDCDLHVDTDLSAEHFDAPEKGEESECLKFNK